MNDFFDPETDAMLDFSDDEEIEYDAPVQVIQLCPPIVRVFLRDMVQSTDSFDECKDDFKIDISFSVEVFCPQQNKILDSGVVVKKIKLSKQALGSELINKSASTPITEAMIETAKEIKKTAEAIIKEGTTDAAKQTMKRMRELAGIPAKGNWV